jgi:hypothetical protein
LRKGKITALTEGDLIVEDAKLWVMIGAAAVAIIGVIVYLVFMIFLPEWVGITGKVALDAEKSHRGGVAEESKFWTSIGQVPMSGESAKDQSQAKNKPDDGASGEGAES